MSSNTKEVGIQVDYLHLKIVAKSDENVEILGGAFYKKTRVVTATMAFSSHIKSLSNRLRAFVAHSCMFQGGKYCAFSCIRDGYGS